jgi:hypothetical protein
MVLPKVGLLELTDAETDENIVVDTSSEEVRTAFATKAQSRIDLVEQVLFRARVDRIPIHTDQGYIEPLIRFFRYRNKR